MAHAATNMSSSSAKEEEVHPDAYTIVTGEQLRNIGREAAFVRLRRLVTIKTKSLLAHCKTAAKKGETGIEIAYLGNDVTRDLAIQCRVQLEQEVLEDNYDKGIWMYINDWNEGAAELWLRWEENRDAYVKAHQHLRDTCSPQ